MGSTDSTTVIVPFDLGIAATFDQNLFPLAYYEREGNLEKGSFLIKATLEEMARISKLGIDLSKNEDFIHNTRLKVEDLNSQREKLQDSRKTRNPFRPLLNYRAARIFHAGTRTLYLQTKRTSEKLHREKGSMQVVPSKQIRIVNVAISPDTQIGGVAVELGPNGWDDNAKQTICDATETIATTDPFEDNYLISQLRDGEKMAVTLVETTGSLGQDVGSSGADEGNRTSVASSDPQQSRPTSPQTIINIIQNSVVTTSSNVNGFTINRDSQNTSVAQEFAPR